MPSSHARTARTRSSADTAARPRLPRARLRRRSLRKGQRVVSCSPSRRLDSSTHSTTGSGKRAAGHTWRWGRRARRTRSVRRMCAAARRPTGGGRSSAPRRARCAPSCCPWAPSATTAESASRASATARRIRGTASCAITGAAPRKSKGCANAASGAGIGLEAQRLLNELPKHLRLMAQFSLATGLRQSNVSYLRWDQVDLERGFAWIHPDQSKSGKAINVPLNNDALSVLQEVQGDDVHYCFVYQGKPVERTSTKAWHAALKRAGIENFRWHDLRHTWASWHVQRGTSLQELQELGGWSSYEMVLRYAHLASHHLKRVAGNVDGTTGTNLVQSQKKKSPAISSEALSIMVPEAESIRSNNLLFYSG